MKILVVGSGGREHALCACLAQSPLVSEVICAPGNAGIAKVARRARVSVDDISGQVALAEAENVDLVVVGPELPLVAGLVDALEDVGIRAFGPRAAAARLEGSKAFTKAFCVRHGIPTAAFRTFSAEQAEEARAYVADQALPVVIKADGLAAGKGVVIAETRDDALAAVNDAFAGAFGEAGREIVVEAFMRGEEASLFALCDGSTALLFGTAQDHKRAFDHDEGPNTGGMGAFSPAANMDSALSERVMREIVEPTLKGMAAEGAPFRGFLYAGLMLTADGPQLIEYNVRFGDPECQVVLPRLESDLAAILLAACDGRLAEVTPKWRDEHAMTVVLAARGYPGSFNRGTVIDGLDAAAAVEGSFIYHAATEMQDGMWRANGGRVLNVTARGRDLQEAHDRAYRAAALVDWPDGFYRRDIGAKALRSNP